MGDLKTGRNAPCPCGSGKKYKKCCLALLQQQDATPEQLWLRVGRANEMLSERLAHYIDRHVDRRFLREAQREFYLWTDPIHRSLQGSAIQGFFHDWLCFGFVPDPMERRDEDLVPLERSLAEEWLEREGRRLGPLERTLMDGARARGNSLFEVRKVEPGVGLGLWDLLCEEPYWVAEHEGSKHAVEGMVLFGHLNPYAELPHLLACSPVALPPGAAPAVLERRRELASVSGALASDSLWACDLEIRDLYFDLVRQLVLRWGEPASHP